MREKILNLLADLKKQKNLPDHIKSQIMLIEEHYKDSFPITSVSKDDIRQALLDADDKIPADVEKRIAEMGDSEMEELASKMADDYIEQLFWISLRILFQDRFLKEEKP